MSTLLPLGPIFALVLCLSQTVCSSVEAQSSVRPPANAVNVDKGPQDGRVPGGVLGPSSDADLWRNIRKGVVGNVSIPDKKAGQLVQSEGENWRAYRNGPLLKYGLWAIGGMTALLIIFYILRGRIRIDAGRSGYKVTRFGNLDRMGHWLLAISFIVLAITGLFFSYGKFLIDSGLATKETVAFISATAKPLHNYVAFAFMAGLLMVLLLWIKDNLPSRYDPGWILKGGGILAKGVHPPAKRFNFGQKLIFWLVILGGISISLSGISLLLPFQTDLFAKTFGLLNMVGFNFPTELTAVEEMQYASTWHAVVAFFLIAVIIAHIYIGTIGMEGAFDAMGSGEVDANWAKEHHSVWYNDDVLAGAGPKSEEPASKAVPAE